MLRCQACDYVSDNFFNINDIKEFLDKTGDKLTDVLIDEGDDDIFCPECFEKVSEQTDDYSMELDDDFIYDTRRDMVYGY